MLVPTYLTKMMALMANISFNDQEGIFVHKCCAVDQMVSANKTCVKADWPGTASIKRDEKSHIVPPLDEAWLQHWLPPGVPPQSIRSVIAPKPYWVNDFSNIVSVNTSSVWDEHKPLSKNIWRTQVVFLEEHFIARPAHLPTKCRVAEYCVDAAEPPLEPFVLVFRTFCNDEECAEVCCQKGKMLVKNGDSWVCEKDDKGYWLSINSLAKEFHKDPEFPYKIAVNTLPFYLAPLESARLASYGYRDFLFSTRKFCVSHHRSSGTLKEGVFYWDTPRISKGIFWLLRPLCVVSALLLAVVLLSIACDSGMRRKVHGWCLFNHALSLFGFNTGQIAFYIIISNQPSNFADLYRSCRNLALSMYFLLMAAWFWLTALCINMAHGFRLQVVPPSRNKRKKVLLFSAFAWGLPATMTMVSSFLSPPEGTRNTHESKPWYRPSLMETRVCFIERLFWNSDSRVSNPQTHKSGTALFYFGPVCCLVFCNVVSLVIALRKMQRLRRGNSILRSEEDLGRRHRDGSTSHVPDAVGAKERTRGRGGASRAAVDAKTIKLYLKMLFMTGVIEIMSEIIMWGNTIHSNYTNDFSFDFHFPYRSSGHVTDCLRAACVAWLAAPEGGYLRVILSCLRGKKQQKCHSTSSISNGI